MEGFWKKESEKREERKGLVREVGAETAEDETRKERADWRRVAMIGKREKESLPLWAKEWGTVVRATPGERRALRRRETRCSCRKREREGRGEATGGRGGGEVWGGHPLFVPREGDEQGRG